MAVRASWSKEEDEILRQAVSKYGPSNNWKIIAQLLPDRTNKACRKRWLHSLSPSIKKTAWTPKEDEELKRLYQLYPEKWAVIARQIPGRTDDACSKRYREALNPNLKTDDWTPEEDVRLLELGTRMGRRWKDIGIELNRGSLSCRNRCRYLERRRRPQSSSSSPLPAQQGGSATLGNDGSLQSIDSYDYYSEPSVIRQAPEPHQVSTFSSLSAALTEPEPQPAPEEDYNVGSQSQPSFSEQSFDPMLLEALSLLPTSITSFGTSYSVANNTSPSDYAVIEGDIFQSMEPLSHASYRSPQPQELDAMDIDHAESQPVADPQISQSSPHVVGPSSLHHSPVVGTLSVHSTQHSQIASPGALSTRLDWEAPFPIVFPDSRGRHSDATSPLMISTSLSARPSVHLVVSPPADESIATSPYISSISSPSSQFQFSPSQPSQNPLHYDGLSITSERPSPLVSSAAVSPSPYSSPQIYPSHMSMGDSLLTPSVPTPQPVASTSYYREPSRRQPSRRNKRSVPPSIPGKDPRLSCMVPATDDETVLPYACGELKCWPSGQTESKSCFRTSKELLQHTRECHDEVDIEADDVDTPWVDKPFRCGLKGCNGAWRTVNGLQYHLQVSTVHFKDALSSRFSKSADKSTGTDEPSKGDGVPEENSSAEPPSNAEETGPEETSSGTEVRKYVCPHPHCFKAYKHKSGLTYHKKHGHRRNSPQQLSSMPPTLEKEMPSRTRNMRFEARQKRPLLQPPKGKKRVQGEGLMVFE